jgi:hypothetical protein
VTPRVALCVASTRRANQPLVSLGRRRALRISRICSSACACAVSSALVCVSNFKYGHGGPTTPSLAAPLAPPGRPLTLTFAL